MMVFTVNIFDPWPGGPKSYLWQPVIASAIIKQTKDGRATNSCFDLTGAQQHGILKIDACGETATTLLRVDIRNYKQPDIQHQFHAIKLCGIDPRIDEKKTNSTYVHITRGTYKDSYQSKVSIAGTFTALSLMVDSKVWKNLASVLVASANPVSAAVFYSPVLWISYDSIFRLQEAKDSPL